MFSCARYNVERGVWKRTAHQEPQEFDGAVREQAQGILLALRSKQWLDGRGRHLGPTASVCSPESPLLDRYRNGGDDGTKRSRNCDNDGGWRVRRFSPRSLPHSWHLPVALCPEFSSLGTIPRLYGLSTRKPRHLLRAAEGSDDSPQPRTRRTSSCQHPQICSSPTTAIATRKVRLKETLCHLGWRVFGRILQSFPREAVQVRFDEPDYAALIRAAELPQDPAHAPLGEPLLAS